MDEIREYIYEIAEYVIINYFFLWIEEFNLR